MTTTNDPVCQNCHAPAPNGLTRVGGYEACSDCCELAQSPARGLYGAAKEPHPFTTGAAVPDQCWECARLRTHQLHHGFDATPAGSHSTTYQALLGDH